MASPSFRFYFPWIGGFEGAVPFSRPFDSLFRWLSDIVCLEIVLHRVSADNAVRGTIGVFPWKGCSVLCCFEPRGFFAVHLPQVPRGILSKCPIYFFKKCLVVRGNLLHRRIVLIGTERQMAGVVIRVIYFKDSRPELPCQNILASPQLSFICILPQVFDNVNSKLTIKSIKPPHKKNGAFQPSFQQ